MTRYQITQDYSPSDYDHAMLISCGAGLVEAIQATESNAIMMLSNKVAQPHIPSYDEYKAGQARISNLISSTDKIAMTKDLTNLNISKAERDHLALDGLVATTMGMLADLSFKLQFAPTVKLYTQLVVAETYGLDVMKGWTFSNQYAQSVYNESKAMYDEFRPKAGQCQELVDAAVSAQDSAKDLEMLMRITVDKLREKFGNGPVNFPPFSDYGRGGDDQEYPPLF